MKSPVKDIEVEFYEGKRLEDYGDSPAFDRWDAFQKFIDLVYENRPKKGGGYNKVKVHIIWENGDFLKDRIDVGEGLGDYKPSRGPIGLYLKGEGVGHVNRGTMYGSSFEFETDDGTKFGKVTETTRDNVQWQDESYSDKELKNMRIKQLKEGRIEGKSDPQREEMIRQLEEELDQVNKEDKDKDSMIEELEKRVAMLERKINLLVTALKD